MQRNKDSYYRVIEMLGYWHTGVNAPILAKQFNVSEKHAKNHLSEYQQTFPHNLVYDKSAKRYTATAQFRPCHIQNDVNAIALYWQQIKIGYVPKVNNRALAKLMDEGKHLEVRVSEFEDEEYEPIRFVVRVG